MAIVHQSFTAAAGATANKPTGTSTGDVLVALVIGGSAASLSGWTVQANTNLASILFLTILTRVVDGSEGSSFTFTVTSPLRVGISRYSGVDTTTPVEGTPTQSASANALTATAASVTTATAGAVLVHGVGWSSGTGTPASTPPGTMTEEWESGSVSSSLLAINDETRASAGATGTRTSTITGPSGTLGHTHAVLIALKPAASGTPATVNAALATATAAMQVPTIAAAAKVAAPLLTATATMQVPSVGVANSVAAPLLTATSQMLAPTITAAATVAAPLLTATAAMLTPVVSIDVVVAPNAPMTATATMLDPTITAAATVSAPVLTATAAFLAPVVTGEAWIDAPLLTASAELLAPTVLAEATVGDVPVLTAIAEMPIPFVGVAPTTTPWAGGQMQPGTQRSVRGSVSARAGVTGTVRQRAGVTMKETP